MTPSILERKIKRVGSIQGGCPQAVKDYQNWMGGVDRHDQLRLQSYSLQMSTRFTKYYKGLFLGFLDLALVNAIRREYNGVLKTCFEIWHEDFGAGENIPSNLGKRVVLRRPGQKAGKRKKTRRELHLRRDEGSECGGGDDAESEAVATDPLQCVI
ncbi:hypothetical protein F443_15569 [Phytophthora nicotianae P1569]|uniref:PiggyBac transposable element-derived protein domain-containing protein n=1 Tax=Phytophthora nicotianae P1569 TaxID=1317065 RepID=V9EL39_PHYNI|nr:hypothetical protein F443_15569 [Phytophthora nicotianae P1569]